MSAKNFKEIIENHPIFDKLKSEENETSDSSSPADQLMAVHDGNLFVWCNVESCLYASNLRISLDEERPTVQTLGCSPPPLFEVRSILFNPPGTAVALIGARGVSVITLPQRWGRKLDEQKQFCRCSPIAERLFTVCVTVRVTEVLWHPGSTSGNHICLLLSDNSLRIFDISSSLIVPVQTHTLGQNKIVGSSRYPLASSRYSISSAIGETVVSFAFAPPVEVEEKKKKILQARSKEPPTTILLHPIYLLQGDGDVFILLTSVTDNRYRKGLMHGPLTMRPPAEDNYGADACSILVLRNTPTVIAIATASGRVHHCVPLTVTTNYDSDDDLSDTQSTASWPASVLSVSGAAQKAEFTPPTLYVYETVEIDLEFLRGEEDSKEMDNHVITLHSDPLLYCRYHCCTKVGVHTAVLPWMEKMTAFFESDDESKEGLIDLTQDQPCIIEHIVCTKPTPSSKACPLKGFAFATNPLFGPSLLCLTSDNKCTSLSLLTSFRPPPLSLLSSPEDEDASLDSTLVNTSSPMRKIIEMDFQDHIKSILKRDASQPILKYDPSSGDAPLDSESSQTIRRTTQILQKEYILKQKIARDAIKKRAVLIAQQKELQCGELEDLKDKQQELTNTAETLAEKFEDCVEKQAELSERLEFVMKNLQSKVPVLSKAEIEMAKELKTMLDQMKNLQNKIKQVKCKLDYQNKQALNETEGSLGGNRKQMGGQGANPLQTQKFREILLEKGQKIQELVKKVNNIKKQVGM